MPKKSIFYFLVLKRLGKNSGIEELVLSGSSDQHLAGCLVRIATTDPANNAKMAGLAAICELIKFIGHKARDIFDACEGSKDSFLVQNMDKSMTHLKARKAEPVETQSGEWLEGISRSEMDQELICARLDGVRNTLSDDQCDVEERCKASV